MKDKILAMTAGILLDSLIAEDVMGWKERVDFDYAEGHIARYIPNTNDVEQFTPSTDIFAAWEVVEKIGRNKFNVEILRRSDGKYFATCKKVGSVSDKLFEVYANADTAPEAISKAALLAVMGDKQ